MYLAYGPGFETDRSRLAAGSVLPLPQHTDLHYFLLHHVASQDPVTIR